ncbi:transposase [Legionella jordanis]|uniref:Transposase n=1 Tax=Legionella jordanis TaxID=456 RepID=A0A0W0VBI6_9GAMM|nr:transposase [Legionella jordanis]KTD17459.1 transposase [Legionella jordanis]VEH13428.1 transposase [Legionella jordanis]
MTVYQPFNHCSSKELLKNFQSSSNDNEAIGKSRGENTTKIHIATDTQELPINFKLTGGEVHNCRIAPEFIKKLPLRDADKEYDSEEV